jgi:hypothetical protein
MSEVKPDGTGIEWRLHQCVIQHRYSAEFFGKNAKPGTWMDTPDVDRIVYPVRRRIIDELLAKGEAPESPVSPALPGDKIEGWSR